MIKVYELFVPGEVSARHERVSPVSVTRSGIRCAGRGCAQPHIPLVRRHASCVSSQHEASSPAAGPLPPPAGLDRVRLCRLARAGPFSRFRKIEDPVGIDRKRKSTAGEPDLGSRGENSRKRERRALRRRGRTGVGSRPEVTVTGSMPGCAVYLGRKSREKPLTAEAEVTERLAKHATSTIWKGVLARILGVLPRLALGFFGEVRWSLARGLPGAAREVEARVVESAAAKMPVFRMEPDVTDRRTA